jgi:general secretion pathway protein G
MRQQKSHSRARWNRSAGLTLIELILTCGVLLVLSSAAIPMARMVIQHRRESDLRRELREMRNAIDRYKDDADKNLIRTEVGSQNYPPDLQTLVDGVSISAAGSGVGGISASALATASNSSPFGATGTQQPGAGAAGGGFSSFGSAASQTSTSGTNLPSKVRYLRAIPVDPMTGKSDWGLRAIQDDPDSTSWGGSNVFDVYSQSQGTATDGTKYSDW